jgi:hypothetical protein
MQCGGLPSGECLPRTCWNSAWGANTATTAQEVPYAHLFTGKCGVHRGRMRSRQAAYGFVWVSRTRCALLRVYHRVHTILCHRCRTRTCSLASAEYTAVECAAAKRHTASCGSRAHGVRCCGSTIEYTPYFVTVVVRALVHWQVRSTPRSNAQPPSGIRLRVGLAHTVCVVAGLPSSTRCAPPSSTAARSSLAPATERAQARRTSAEQRTAHVQLAEQHTAFLRLTLNWFHSVVVRVYPARR